MDLAYPRDLVMFGAVFAVAAFVWAGWAQENPPGHLAWRILLGALSLGGLVLAGLSISTVPRRRCFADGDRSGRGPSVEDRRCSEFLVRSAQRTRAPRHRRVVPGRRPRRGGSRLSTALPETVGPVSVRLRKRSVGVRSTSRSGAHAQKRIGM